MIQNVNINQDKLKIATSLNSESDIIQAIANGDKQYFSILYERFSEKVYNTALSEDLSLDITSTLMHK